jgi:8-oxo-dGTP pyrophosphatase MutT (NUDIX family)
VHRQRLLGLIDEYAHRYPDERAVVARFREFLAEHPRCFERDCWAGHITGSAWLVNPAGTHVLLTHHRKLGRWLQLGGHSDGDPDPLAVARREAEEESGLAVRMLDKAIFDLDVHEIPARKTDPAHFHFDVRFSLVAEHESFAVSRESLELAWVPLTELATYSGEESVLRMGWKWLAAGRNGSQRLIV